MTLIEMFHNFDNGVGHNPTGKASFARSSRQYCEKLAKSLTEAKISKKVRSHYNAGGIAVSGDYHFEYDSDIGVVEVIITLEPIVAKYGILYRKKDGPNRYMTWVEFCNVATATKKLGELR